MASTTPSTTGGRGRSSQTVLCEETLAAYSPPIPEAEEVFNPTEETEALSNTVIEEPEGFSEETEHVVDRYQTLKSVYKRAVHGVNFKVISEMTPALYLHDTFGLGFSERGEEEFLEAEQFMEPAKTYIRYLIRKKMAAEECNEEKNGFSLEIDHGNLSEDEYISRFLLCLTVSFSHATNALFLLDRGIVDDLVTLLNLYGTPNVVASGFRCLARLSKYHKRDIRNLQIPELIIRYMNMYEDNLLTTHSGIILMNNLSHNFATQAQKRAFCALLVKAVKRFSDNPFVQRSASHTLHSDVHPFLRSFAPKMRLQELQKLDVTGEIIHECTVGHITISTEDRFCRKCNRPFITEASKTSKTSTSKTKTPEEKDATTEFPKYCLELPFFDPPHTYESYFSVLRECTELIPDLIVVVVRYLRKVAVVGDLIDVLDCVNKWCLARIVEVQDENCRIKISYVGYESIWDEWLRSNSSRIAYKGTYTCVIPKYV